MSSMRFVGSLALLALLLFACGDDGGGDESGAGELGQPCIGGTFCNEGLMCSAGTCMAGDDEAGDGDGDSSETDSGDGDGDPSDTSTSDTGNPEFGLYQGPCANGDECADGQWCATDEGRSWCAMDCTTDMDCPALPSAAAVPRCEGLDDLDGGSAHLGCVLDCVDETECPEGAQCFYSGLADKNWCGFLP